MHWDACNFSSNQWGGVHFDDQDGKHRLTQRGGVSPGLNGGVECGHW